MLGPFGAGEEKTAAPPPMLHLTYLPSFPQLGQGHKEKGQEAVKNLAKPRQEAHSSCWASSQEPTWAGARQSARAANRAELRGRKFSLHC